MIYTYSDAELVALALSNECFDVGWSEPWDISMQDSHEIKHIIEREYNIYDFDYSKYHFWYDEDDDPLFEYGIKYKFLSGTWVLVAKIPKEVLEEYGLALRIQRDINLNVFMRFLEE
jgi:hypothetical protein